MVVKVVKTRNVPDLTKATSGSAGYELYAADVLLNDKETVLSTDDLIYILPGQTIKFLTGYVMEIPKGYEGQIRSRSGLSVNKGLVVADGIGTIDSDYRGEIIVAIRNESTTIQSIKTNERIAQIIFSRLPVVNIEYVEPDELSETERSLGGFGSTGTSHEDIK